MNEIIDQRRPKVFTWHIHGSYLYYLSQGNYDLYIPVNDEKSEGYYGRGKTFPFSNNVIEVPANEVRNLDFDLVLFQTDDKGKYSFRNKSWTTILKNCWPMKLTPQKSLSEDEIQKGLKLVIWDGLTAEVMISFTGGAFLVAMALLLGANNVQIGLLAALPMITNLSQLISIWLVREYNNRRIVAVYCAFLARIPLITIGLLVWWLTNVSVNILIFFLFFHYFFGSIAGPSWNSWMKDMVPEKMLGSYFSRRSRYTQTLNVILSIALAILLDLIKNKYPEYELNTYAIFFIIAGIIGIIGGYILSKAPEPQSYLSNANIFSLFKLPLRDVNFRRLLIFNSMWVFALNIATPFFTVFMIKSMGLPLSYIIILGVITQLFSILTLRMWGVFSDRYSNKSIIALSAPIYILCIIAWCFVGIYSHQYANITLLVAIHIFSGISTAGINLSLTNIGLKLANWNQQVQCRPR